MRTKEKDIFYCGVDKEKIKTAKPKLNGLNLKRWYEWVSERYSIHIKKDVLKLKKPWTKNEILLRYRFTNVRREQDKESKFVIKKICENSNLSYENKLLNIILFRLVNKHESYSILGNLDFFSLDLNSIKLRVIDFEKKNKGFIYFSNAFFTSGQKRVANLMFKKEKSNLIKMIFLVKHYLEKGLIDKVKNSKSQNEVYESLLSMDGLGRFLAYQIYIDFSYILEFPFSENEFVIAGPGCVKGLKLIFKDFSHMNYEEALFWLRDNQFRLLGKFGYNPKKLFSDLEEYDRYMNLMCVEGCMCELSKYVRAIEGNGRPRVRYNGI